MNIKKLKNESYMTLLFLTIQTIIFTLMQTGLFGGSESFGTILKFGGLFTPLMIAEPSNLWRLVTPIFVHIGFAHFIFNSVVLYYLGKQAEEVFGHLRFSMIYLGSGILGNCMSFIMDPYSISAGASGSLMGLFGAFIILRFIYKDNIYVRELSKNYVILIVITMVSSVLTPSVSFWGHFGGVIGGLLLPLIVTVPNYQGKMNKHYRVMALIVYIFLIISTIFLAFAKFS